MSAGKTEPYIKQLTAGGTGLGLDSVDEDDPISASDHQPPLQCIKLKLFGHCRVGKTTLVDSLRCGYFRALFRQLSRSRKGHNAPAQGQTQGQTPASPDVERASAGDDHDGCTRCVDVRRIDVSGRPTFHFDCCCLQTSKIDQIRSPGRTI